MTEPIKEVVVKPGSFTQEALSAKVAGGEQLTNEEREFLKGNPDSEEETPAPPAEEETPPVEEAPPAAAPKPGDKPKEPSAQTPEERRKIIDAELEKPVSKQNLSQFSEAEVGLFIDLRKQRAKNQRLESENELLRLQNKLAPGEAPKAAAPPAQEEEDPLAGREDGDIVTVAEMKKILKGSKPKETQRIPAPLITPEETRIQEIAADANLKTQGLEDFKEVTEFTAMALYDDLEAQQILRETAQKKENVAEQVYWLIKGSKRWPIVKAAIEAQKAKVTPPAKPGTEKPAKPAAATRELPPENVARAERLKQNDGKVTTTGPGGGADESVGEYTAEDVRKMSTVDWAALPKPTREKLLIKFG